MFTQYTFEDWSAAQDKAVFLKTVISAYKSCEDFTRALAAQRYFAADNDEIKKKNIVQLDVQEAVGVDGAVKTVANKVEVAGTRISSSFLFRFVTQQNQHLLGNGVTLADEALKKRLGRAFDTALASMGEKPCWTAFAGAFGTMTTWRSSAQLKTDRAAL